MGGFDPDNAAESRTLPSTWYHDAEIFEPEKQRLFSRTWVYAGQVTDLVAPGDYLTALVGDQSVFVIRNDENELQAFYNVCSHRAHPLLEGSGNTKLIVCPYHQWCYKKNGQFRSAKGH